MSPGGRRLGAPIALRLAGSLLVALTSVPTSAGQHMQALIKQLKSEDLQVRRNTAIQLGELGVSAASAVPALRELLHRSSIEEGDEDIIAAAWALGQSGERGVKALIDELRRRDEVILEPVIDGLVGSGSGAVPQLIAALDEPSEYMRDAVARALGGIGPAAQGAVPALISAARFRSAQDMPIWALGKIGAATKEVVPFLAGQLSGTDEARRLAACSALGEIGPPASDAVPRLQKLLGDPSPSVRAAAAGALGEVGPAAIQALPSLRAALSDANPYVRSQAAAALDKVQRRRD